jgi:hypothetical protein
MAKFTYIYAIVLTLFLALFSQIVWAAPQVITMNETEFNATMVVIGFSKTKITLNKNVAVFTPSNGYARLGMRSVTTPLETFAFDPSAVVNDMNSSVVSINLVGDHIHVAMQFEEDGPEIVSNFGKIEISNALAQFDLGIAPAGSPHVFSIVSSGFSGTVTPNGFFGIGTEFIKNKVLELSNKNIQKELKQVFESEETQMAIIRGLAMWAEFSSGIPNLQVDPNSIQIKNGVVEYSVY